MFVNKSDIEEAKARLEDAKRRMREVSRLYRWKPIIIGAAFVAIFAVMVMVAP